MINPLRGMKDLIFEDSQKFVHIVTTAIKIAKNYGYTYIETPILEETALFKRSVGESSDIVGKEMYQFIDKGANDVCMRPEGTAGIVRAFISNKLDRQDATHRFYYYGPMFRYERPQKGRLRSFHQFGCESFAEASVYEDFTIISMVSDIFDALGIRYNLEINSLGDNACMPDYKEKLIAFLESKKESLCSDCNRRIVTNPVRVLDCKNESCKTILKDAPKLIDNLCDSCRDDLDRLCQLLSEHKITYTINTNLVRGLDYYTKSAFEFVSTEVGAQSAIAGGGRYDKLVEFLGGKSTPAIGFALGIERIMDLVELPEQKREGLYLGTLDTTALPLLLQIAKEKRAVQKVYVEYEQKSLKSHLKSADKLGYLKACIIGENELKDKTVWVKDLQSKEEQHISLDVF
ncbi:MAG: histidine--tRNA ligase [Campylobacterales bacterium]|nr:histidine--tRNA ligase [Campylobacterales bacterium]